jgi:predicted RNA-binding Zn-ribbon protein involved in translation (DUF1610 family)
MDLLCPHCTSADIEARVNESATAYRCENCGERFDRACALVRLREAEAEIARQRSTPSPFKLHRDRAAQELARGAGAITTVHPHCDADELDALARDALLLDIIARADPRAEIAVHPRSLVDPDPLLAVSLGPGPTLLGSSLTVSQHRDEGPVDFTLRVLTLIVEAANQLAGANGG